MSEPLAASLILEAKRDLHGHVVIGKDQVQIQFLVEVLGGPRDVEVRELEQVDDVLLLERLANPRPFLYVLASAKGFNIAEDVKRRIGVWSTPPIRKHTAALRALVRRGGEMAGAKDLPAEQLDRIGNLILDKAGDDLDPRALLWAAAWASTGSEEPEEENAWKNPWDSPWSWRPKGIGMAHRLNALYRTLVAWAYARDGIKPGDFIKSPSHYRWLQGEHLDPAKVTRAIQVLSKGRTRPDLAYETALAVGIIFDRG